MKTKINVYDTFTWNKYFLDSLILKFMPRTVKEHINRLIAILKVLKQRVHQCPPPKIITYFNFPDEIS